MKRYPAWQALYRSFYSMDFYRDVAANWKEFGFLHLFLLAGLNWAALAISFQVAFSTFCDTMLLPMTDQLPTITAADGKFSMDKPSPYKVKDQTGNTIMVFDFSGHPSTQQDGSFLISETGITSAQSPNGERIIKAEEWPAPGSLGPSAVHSFINLFRTYGALVLFFAGWIMGTIFLFIQALLYSTVGLIMNSVMNAKLKYSQLMRLAAVSITPPILIDSLMKAFAPLLLSASPAVVWSIRLGSIVASMVYLGLAINACKSLAASVPQGADPLAAATPTQAPAAPTPPEATATSYDVPPSDSGA